MFIHNLKYSLKTLFRKKELIFWTFAFPIILGTFFYLAFSDIEKSEKLDLINIAIVENDNYKDNEIYKTAFKELSDDNSNDKLFNIQYITEKQAEKLLNDKEIVGYLKLINDEPQLTFATSGINETIFKYVVEEISQTSNIIKNLSEEEIKNEISGGNYNINYESIYSKIDSLIKEDNIKLNNISNNNLSYTMIEFYSLIAMTCLYGGLLGMVAINQVLANMSSEGKRISVSPTKKSKLILSSLFASYIIQIIGVSLLFLYTIFVLKVDYGNNLLLLTLLTMIGSFAGLSLGVVIATTTKASDNAKTGIIIAITMIGCFLTGMMSPTIKYIVDKNIPIINKINPANMITDGFYSLYYYDTLNRYVFNIVSLLIFAIILILISYISLRRQKYDSI